MDYILLASFVAKEIIDGFIEVLDKDFNIKRNQIFIFTIEENNIEYLVTYRVKKVDRDKISKFFNGIHTIHVHTKNGCIFSINALNKLIDENYYMDKANSSFVEINWSQYTNKLLILNKDKLSIKTIKKEKL